MIELKNIFYSPPKDLLFSKNDKIILSNISFTIEQGDIFGVIGESGAGKTTLGKIVGGILKAPSGVISYNSVSMDEIQILFQNSSELINPYRKVRSLLTDTTNGDADKINNLIESVKLYESVLEKYSFQLSGGERQRIALARILATNPKLLIIDEPFSAQDFESQLNLMELFNELNCNTGLTILCISHDLEIMKKFTNKLVVMKDGVIVENGLTSKVVTNPNHKYTKFLFKAANYQLTHKDFDDLL
ncbi:MAG: ATP-binding cassette domain-containing protein [Melioribacteraceae bacterium]|nr:ATP-binding cassette domain-containing protein [Melioribacteraceae bacterium]